MQTATETRRTRLEMLISKYGSVADLNAALGWPRTDPKLVQIRNANQRAGRAKPYQMGDAMAREIEELLGLERGLMDTPPTYAELHDGKPDPKSQALAIMEKIPEEAWPMALRLLDALGKQPEEMLPHRRDGTND